MKGTEVCVFRMDMEGLKGGGAMSFVAHMELLTIRCIWWRVRALQAACTNSDEEEIRVCRLRKNSYPWHR